MATMNGERLAWREGEYDRIGRQQSADNRSWRF